MVKLTLLRDIAELLSENDVFFFLIFRKETL